MATTAAGARLTEIHRVAQARLAAQVVGQLLASARLVDPTILEKTVADWLRVVLPLIRFQRRQSAGLAAQYVTAFRTLEGPGPIVATPAVAIPDEQLITSLIVTGPVALRRNMVIMTIEQALERFKVMTAGAALRHVLNGGRDTIDGTIDTDRTALGWARHTSGRPCAFCAMLASRGPVYKSRRNATARSDGRSYHDHCHCFAEPVYSRDAEWPGRAREFQALWNSSTAGYSGKDAINAFRRAYEHRA